MKLIITGATGFIGSAILRQSITHPSITSIILLIRRAIDPSLYSNSPKVKTIIMKDFNEYNGEVREEMKSADACCWCMGSNGGGDVDVNLRFPVRFLEVLGEVLGSGSGAPPKTFRYVHLGGAFCVRDQDATGLWFLEAARKLRGNAEAQVLSMASSPTQTSKPYTLETIVFRPGGVYGGNSGMIMSLGARLAGETLSVHCDELGAAMVEVAVEGYKGKGSEVYGEKTVENVEIVRIGREVLGRRGKA